MCSLTLERVLLQLLGSATASGGITINELDSDVFVPQPYWDQVHAYALCLDPMPNLNPMSSPNPPGTRLRARCCSRCRLARCPYMCPYVCPYVCAHAYRSRARYC